MRYPVSSQYIAARRGGPRRVALVLVAVGVLFAALVVWLRGRQVPGAEFAPLLGVGLMMGAIGYVQSRRMAKATSVLATFAAEVTDERLVVESSAGRQVIKANEVQQVLLFRSLFSPRELAYVGLKINGRLAVVPPLQDNAGFAKDLRRAMPHASQVGKRKLVMYLGL